MAGTDKVGDQDIRGENINKVVKVWAQKKFKLKPLLMNVKSSKWKETYYKEDPAILTASGTRNVNQVGRFSQFPTVERSWTEVSAEHFKYAASGRISYEDILTNAINVQARTINGIVESIVNAIDIRIYAALTAETSTSGTVAAVANWDASASSTRDPMQDIYRGIQAMDENNYDAQDGGLLLLNPHDYASLMMNSKIINNPTYKSADVVTSGRMGQIAHLTLIKTTSVTDDEAMIIINQKSGTWMSVVGMTTAIEKDAGIKTTIKSWEIGQIQITDPKAIYTITGTEE